MNDKTMPMPLEVSIVIPTFNERDNVAPLITLVEKALHGVAWELIFVDDNSPDGTSDVVKSIAANDPRIRCIRRIGRRGLAGASIEGMLSSSAPFVAVMDGDLQHDESILLEMLKTIRADDVDLVIATHVLERVSERRGAPELQLAEDLDDRLDEV